MNSGTCKNHNIFFFDCIGNLHFQKRRLYNDINDYLLRQYFCLYLAMSIYVYDCLCQLPSLETSNVWQVFWSFSTPYQAVLQGGWDSLQEHTVSIIINLLCSDR